MMHTGHSRAMQPILLSSAETHLTLPMQARSTLLEACCFTRPCTVRPDVAMAGCLPSAGDLHASLLPAPAFQRAGINRKCARRVRNVRAELVKCTVSVATTSQKIIWRSQQRAVCDAYPVSHRSDLSCSRIGYKERMAKPVLPVQYLMKLAWQMQPEGHGLDV